MSIDLKIILDVTGTFLTAFSIFWGINVYKKTSDTEAFSKLRTSLIDIQRTLNSSRFQRLLSEESFCETAISITNQMRSLFDIQSCTSGSILELLSHIEEDAFFKSTVFTAISDGLYCSNARKESREVTESLSRIPLSFESHVPLVSEILNGCMFYIIAAIEYTTNASSHIVLIKRDESFENYLKCGAIKDFGDAQHKEIIFRKLAESFRNGSIQNNQNYSQKAISASQSILNILTEVILKKSDKEMIKLRDKSKKIYSIKLPNETSTPIDKTFFYLEQLKDEFDTHQWDSIIIAKNEIRRTWYGTEFSSS